MNQNAETMRNMCHKWLGALKNSQKPMDDKQVQKNIIIVLDQMHLRLALLEGVEDLRSLEDKSF